MQCGGATFPPLDPVATKMREKSKDKRTVTRVLYSHDPTTIPREPTSDNSCYTQCRYHLPYFFSHLTSKAFAACEVSVQKAAKTCTIFTTNNYNKNSVLYSHPFTRIIKPEKETQTFFFFFLQIIKADHIMQFVKVTNPTKPQR